MKQSKQAPIKKISLFAPFKSKKHLNEYIKSLCYGKVKEGDIYLLLQMFEQTILEGGFKNDK